MKTTLSICSITTLQFLTSAEQIMAGIEKKRDVRLNTAQAIVKCHNQIVGGLELTRKQGRTETTETIAPG